MSLVTIVSLLAAGGGALAEEVQDPTRTACVGVEDAADCEAVAVAIGGDAACEEHMAVAPTCVAVSDSGDADCEVRWCVAASGSGDAEGWYAVSVGGNATGIVALAGTGDAEGSTAAASGTGDADGRFIAVSGTGDATTRSLGLVAVSGTGDASHEEVGLVAISGTGNASSDIAAASGTGNASSHVAAASGAGNTSAERAEVNGMNDADGCHAVSGTGSADASCREGLTGQPYEVSGCDTGQDAGTDAACAGPDQHHEPADAVVCDTDLATSDGEGHAWCRTKTTGCVQIIWGAAAGPVFVGGHDGCQAGAFYDEDGHDHAPLP